MWYWKSIKLSTGQFSCCFMISKHDISSKHWGGGEKKTFSQWMTFLSSLWEKEIPKNKNINKCTWWKDDSDVCPEWVWSHFICTAVIKLQSSTVLLNTKCINHKLMLRRPTLLWLAISNRCCASSLLQSERLETVSVDKKSPNTPRSRFPHQLLIIYQETEPLWKFDRQISFTCLLFPPRRKGGHSHPRLEKVHSALFGQIR